MKVAFHTLGCKVNKYESEVLAELFREQGYTVVDENDYSDIYVINTCTVTALADRKSRQYIRRMKKKNPNSIIAVTGCYAQMDPQGIKDICEVDIIAGINEKKRLPQYVKSFLETRTKSIHVTQRDRITEYEDLGVLHRTEDMTRAYIKIEEGCDRFCAYCVIPYARGKVRSRPEGEIIKEAKALLNAGYRELVLTGINTALYGRDFKSGQIEGEALESVVAQLDDLNGDFRLRLSSLEPTVVDAHYVKRLLKYERLCHHLHLSLQSGSDRILSMMGRGYKVDDYLRIVDMLKTFDANYGITTDIIAGFPGETEEDFKETVDVIEKVGFGRIHPFKYSKRPGTRAEKMSDQIDAREKSKRVERLISAGEKVARIFFDANIGTLRKVLIEKYDDKGFMTGYTDNYIKVYIKEKLDTNEMYNVELIEPYKDGMKGRVL